MKTSALAFAAVVVSLLGSGACSSSGDAEQPASSIADCEVAIVGGGAGGLHTAFRLAPSMGAKVCLFEKESELGGRIRDVAFDDAAGPEAPRVGLGARRVMETQDVLFALAAELGIELEKPANQADLIQARKVFSFSKDEIAEKAYPTIPAPSDPESDRETVLYDTLRASPERATLPNPKYPDFQSYIKQVAGEEQYQFLRDVSRFRADFEYALDARGYLDYLDEEWDVCCQPEYPKGGMSAFVRGMEARATQAGARIFKAEPVTTIQKKEAGYEITTPMKTVKASKVVLAVPPAGLEKIGGDVVERVKAQPVYQQIVGVKVVTVTQWWPEAWWKPIADPKATENANVWRAWTTEHCLNFIEIPIEPYADAQKVTRSVYVDNQRCADFWDELAKQGTARVDEELGRGLTALFNNGGVSTPAVVAIPKPMKTVVHVWPAAWHWLKAGATVTNAELADWAVQPLAGEEVALVGEAYYVNRSGWTDGAFKSSIKLLNTKYGQSLPGLKPKSAPMASIRTRSFWR